MFTALFFSVFAVVVDSIQLRVTQLRPFGMMNATEIEKREAKMKKRNTI